MAVVLLFRAAIFALNTPAGRIGLTWVASGGSTYYGAIEKGVLSAIDWYMHGEGDADDLEDQLNAADAPEDSPGWVVTDFPAPFELRKLQWRLSRAPSTSPLEDVDVCTFHFIKATGGTPGTWVDGTDLPALETKVSAYWTAIKSNFPTFTVSDQFRWYHDGPAYYHLNSEGTHFVPNGDNPAIRVTEVNDPGTGTGAALPPQVAMSITEVVSSRRHWGRWYLPAGAQPSVLNTDGRIVSSAVTSQLSAAVSFYNSCRSSGYVPVVFSIEKPARESASGGTLPAAPAVAYEVLSLQMDDLFDVIRSRRYDLALNKPRTVLT